MVLARLLLAGASPEGNRQGLDETPRGPCAADRAERRKYWRGSGTREQPGRARPPLSDRIRGNSIARWRFRPRRASLLIRSATREGPCRRGVVDWLNAARLIGAASDVLDLGCGIGRVAARSRFALRSVLGLDVSQAMIDEARRNALKIRNSSSSSGNSILLACVRAFDLVLAGGQLPLSDAGGSGGAARG